MPQYLIDLDSTNAAFHDDTVDDEDSPLHAEARDREIARLLDVAVRRFKEGRENFLLFDLNGNRVGAGQVIYAANEE